MYGDDFKRYSHRNELAHVLASTTMLMVFLTGACQAEDAKKIVENNATLDEIQAAIEAFQPQTPDDRFALVALQEALDAARESNFGYGACLVNKSTGEVVELGHNHIFYPYFRSDLHAEMDVLNKYEERVNASDSRTSGLVMYCSGEPGPMALARIINAGIRKMYYLTESQEGGMVHMMDCLPPIWQEMAKGRDFRQADCSPQLADLSEKIINYSVDELNRRLKSD
jgi:tRNA(adenine34) deaminase